MKNAGFIVCNVPTTPHAPNTHRKRPGREKKGINLTKQHAIDYKNIIRII